MITEIALIQGAVSKIFGDLVSKAVSDGVDISIKGIKDADQNRKSYSQNLRTQIYHVIVDSLNEFTNNKYREQDELYDAAESILRGFVSGKDDTVTIKSGLKMLVSGVNDNICQDFLEIICRKICRDENSDLYKEMNMLWKGRESKYIHGEFEKNKQNNKEMHGDLGEIRKGVNYIKDNMNIQEGYKAEHYEIPIENRADEYERKWDKNVFLNNFNKRDKNVGVNIKLKDIYLEKHLPHYVWKTKDEPLCDLKELLSEYIVDNDDKKMLLILGQPGIGKSTLITWIMANLVEEKDQVLVYQFASDLKNVNWQGNNILNDIFKVLKLRYDKIENKVLILDGFDEIHASCDREKILNQIYHSLKEMNYLKKISLIITCRKNYIDELKKVKCDHITLQTWDDEQIKSFCEIYWNVCIRSILQNILDKMLENKSVFGIPLILYMVLALDISIEGNASLVDIYDKIFTVDGGGIYDRCIDDLSYGKEHRISEVKQQIHQVSQRIAFWIFENNSEKATIPRIEFKKICDIVMKEAKGKTEDMQSDVLIGNYFEPIRHCEGFGTDELQFVHRSIYEYFVAVYFFESISSLTSKEEVAGKLGELLKDGCLSQQILEFVKYKFDSIKEYNLSDIIREVFNIMLRDGMTYHIKENPYNNIIEREMNIFSNMRKVLGLWNPSLGELDKRIAIYLQCNREKNLKLSGAILSRADLSRANLSGADLSKANLSRANLSGADLSRANLSGADLSGADLSKANLSRAFLIRASLNGADLSGADLSGVNLSEAYLGRASLSGANLSRANLSGTDLSGANLSEVYLGRANLSEVYLDRANLSRANLSGVNLSGADLSGTDLSKANLSGAHLGGAHLNESIFNEEQVDILYKIYDLSSICVFFSETDEIISYKEYCAKKPKLKRVLEFFI